MISKLKSWAVLLLLISSITSPAGNAYAQNGYWTDNPGGHTGLAGRVNATVVDNTGVIYVAGGFITAGSKVANRIASWNATTGRWQSMGQGFNGMVLALATDSAGTLYAGGAFSTADGKAASNIARWNASAATWEALGAGVSDTVLALSINDSGSLFASVGTTYSPNHSVVLWNEASGSWQPLGSGMDGPVSALASDSAGRLYAAGNFNSAGAASARNVAMWNIPAQRWEALGPGLDDRVQALATDSAGNLYAGGYFYGDGVTELNSITRWNVSAQRWEALGSGIVATRFAVVPPYENDVVNALVIDVDDNVYVGGYFSQAGGKQSNGVARWNASAQNWEAFGEGVGREDGGLPEVFALSIDASGQVLAGGSFYKAGGIPASNFAALNAASQTWKSFGSGITVGQSLVTDSVGNLYAAGRFNTAPGVSVGNVAVKNMASGQWQSLGSGVNGRVRALVNDGSDNIYAAGDFTIAGGEPANGIARWDANSRRWESLGAGTNATVYALAADAAGNIYAGGDFTIAGGIPANSVARWNAASKSWEALGNGLNGYVSTLAIDNMGSVIAGGNFANPQNGTRRDPRVAQWNLARQSWQALGPPRRDGVVSEVATDAAGTVYLAAQDNGLVDNNSTVSRWNASSQRWEQLGGKMNDPLRGRSFNIDINITIDSAGTIYAGGSFTHVNDKPARYLARWNSAMGRWDALESQLDDRVKSLHADRGGRIYASGLFSTAGGKASPGIALWTPETEQTPILTVAPHRWKQLSLPCNPAGNNTVAQIFGDDELGNYGFDWLMWSFDPIANTYIRLSEESELSQGNAYWFIQTNGSTRQIDMPVSCSATPRPAACPSAGGCFDVPLAGNPQRATFQMIGYPFARPSPISEAYVLTNTSDCAGGCVVGSAAANRYLNPYLFTYDGVAYQIAQPGGAYSDWAGYWALVMPEAANAGARLVFGKGQP